MAISVEKAVIARLTRSGEKFEILVDPENALEAKRGKNVPLDSLLAAPEIFEDARKGLKAGDSKLNKAFGTNDIEAIAYKIIKDGEVQLTTEQRRKMTEEKTKAIANIISKRGVNPQTGAPHPTERVLHAMEKAKVRIDMNKSAEEQIDSVLKGIQSIIPVKFEKIVISIKVPPAYAGRAPSLARNFGSLQKEEWGKDGSYLCNIEIPAAIQQEVYDKLNSLTHGEAEIKIIKKI